MEIQRNELIKAMEAVRPGLASKEIIDQSTKFAFMEDHIATFNGEISTRHPFDIRITAAVEASDIYDFLKKSKGDVIKMEVEEDKLLIKAGRATAKIAIENNIILPFSDLDNVKSWNKLSPDFLLAIKFVSFSASKDMSTPIFTAINVREDGIIETTDTYRITQYTIDKMPVSNFLIPARNASVLLQYELTHIALKEQWVYFKTVDGTIISCAILAEDKFPNTDAVMKTVKEGEEIIFPKTLPSILERAILFIDEPTDMISFEIKKGKLYVKAQNSIKEFEEPVKINTEVDFSFKINPLFLQDILKRSNKCILKDNRIMFMEEGWKHLAMITV